MKEHISLYRKWRPKTLAEIVGQNHITQTLANALGEERLSHAYLFCGPRGTGKTTTARILAKAVNCQEGPTATPCNECLSCREIEDTVSGDVLEIDAASNRGIDEIRNLRESISFAPVRGRKRVYIIDEVHMLTPEAFNAFLKTLEEPPEHVIFVLATTEPHRVPATILSRCQRFDFRQITNTDMVAQMRKVASSEGIETEEAVLNLLTKQAKGSLRDALGILEQLASFSGKKVQLSGALSFLGLVESDLLFEITDALKAKDTAKGLLFVEELAEKGRDFRQFVKEWQNHLRQLLLVHQADRASAMEIVAAPPETFARLEGQARDFRPLELAQFLEFLREAGQEMRFDDPRLGLELAIVRMTRVEEELSLEGVLYRLDKLEQQLKAANGATAVLDEGPVKGAEDRAPVAGGDGAEAGAGGGQAVAGDAGAEAEQVKAGAQDGEAPREKRQFQKAVPDSDVQGDGPDGENAAREEPETVPGNAVSEKDERAAMGIEKIKRLWPEFMKRVKSQSIPVHALLLEAHPVGIDEEKVTMGFPSQAAFHKGQVEQEGNLAVVERALKEASGLSLKATFVLEQAPTRKAAANKPQAKKSESRGSEPTPVVSSKEPSAGKVAVTEQSEASAGASGPQANGLGEGGLINYLKKDLEAEVVDEAGEGGSQ